MRGIGIAAVALVTAVGVAACGGHQARAPAAAPTSATKHLPTPGTQPGPPQPPELSALALASQERGVGVFIRVAGAGCQEVSAETTDGGERFRNVAPITSYTCANGAPTTAVAADGAGDLFAYGPGFFEDLTGSGGWRASPQPGAVLAVSAIGQSVWLLLAECSGTSITANGCLLSLAESADGGRTWQAAPSQPVGAVTAGSSAGPALSGGTAAQSWLVRTGPATGYVLASPETNPDGKPDEAPIWFTGDGGGSWSALHVDCGFDAISDAAAAAPGGILAIVCAGEPGGGLQLKSTAVSVDGGLTWTVQTGCLLRPGCQDQLYDGYLGQICVVSAETIYLVGSRSSLLVTTDGGARWRSVQPPIGDGSDGSFSVVFFGPADGVVVAAGASTDELPDIFHTADGGRTWSRVQPQLS